MTRIANPYRPGFNQPPVVFAGRAEVLDGAREALEVAALDGRTQRPFVLLGPRGVGKTVTLGEVAEHAATERSWPHVHVEAKAAGGLLEELTERLGRAARLLGGEVPDAGDGGRRAVRVSRVSATVMGVGGEVALERAGQAGESAAARLADALDAVMGAAVARGAGIVLTLDELHVADPEEIAVLAGTLQENVPADWPLVTIFAALPSLRAGRGRRALPTYLERAEWHVLGNLEGEAAREALVGPAVAAGRPMAHGAADLLLGEAGGYPYALQVAGHFAWRASHGAAAVTDAHAEAALPRIRTDLAHLFRGRWDDASNREREYLRALARLLGSHDGAVVRGGDVAAALGQPTTKVSYLRDRLMKKGTLYADGSGGLHFIAPGMGEWFLHDVDCP
ncbi:MAG: AAA family ATPase [Marmoricola sp.]